MGIIDRVKIGMTRDEVAKAIGPPDDHGGTNRKYRTPSIYKYGAIELRFEPWKDGRSVWASVWELALEAQKRGEVIDVKDLPVP